MAAAAFTAGALGLGCNGPSTTGTLGPGDLPMQSVSDGIWESVPWSDGTWAGYPSRTLMSISHSLGRAPRTVLVYLAADETGTGAGLATGDQARVIEVTETTVTVENATDQGYFARFVLE